MQGSNQTLETESQCPTFEEMLATLEEELKMLFEERNGLVNYLNALEARDPKISPMLHGLRNCVIKYDQHIEKHRAAIATVKSAMA